MGVPRDLGRLCKGLSTSSWAPFAMPGPKPHACTHLMRAPLQQRGPGEALAEAPAAFLSQGHAKTLVSCIAQRALPKPKYQLKWAMGAMLVPTIRGIPESNAKGTPQFTTLL